ncbi:hypothetical protein BDN72DRAFT_863618 [Pluteus cervinus]|uniref:Uncharacterized protein n=1 Tax=Pluteus cervinus TaxID=181527 RepID=A0ACD3A6U7_9AGAR|nr:hypothetical protein BDN72DRAFT_863618 [Pluteus cervinus]
MQELTLAKILDEQKIGIDALTPTGSKGGNEHAVHAEELKGEKMRWYRIDNWKSYLSQVEEGRVATHHAGDRSHTLGCVGGLPGRSWEKMKLIRVVHYHRADLAELRGYIARKSILTTASVAVGADSAEQVSRVIERTLKLSHKLKVLNSVQIDFDLNLNILIPSDMLIAEIHNSESPMIDLPPKSLDVFFDVNSLHACLPSMVLLTYWLVKVQDAKNDDEQ